MTNKEFQARLVALRNALADLTSDLILVDNGLPKRLKAFSVPRLVIMAQGGGPVSVIDVIKAVAQAIEDSRQMAEAWARIADGDEGDSAGEPAPVPARPVRKMDD